MTPDSQKMQEQVREQLLNQFSDFLKVLSKKHPDKYSATDVHTLKTIESYISYQDKLEKDNIMNRGVVNGINVSDLVEHEDATNESNTGQAENLPDQTGQ